MNTISQILVTSAEIVVDTGDDIKTGMPELKKNQVVDAKVLKVVSLRQAQLQILGKKVFARTHVPLKAGDNVLLKVAKTGSQQVFRLIQEERADVFHANHALLKAMGRSGPYENLVRLITNFEPQQAEAAKGARLESVLNRLEELLRTISLKSGAADQGFLKSLIKNSGLLWENKLFSAIASSRGIIKDNMTVLAQKDLKAFAMKLIMDSQIENNEADKNIRSFVDGLEKLQLLNRSAAEEFGRYILPLPVYSNGIFKFGQMLIDLGHHESSRKNPDDRLIKVSFLLEMSHLGDIRADFSILKQAVTGSFGVGNKHICAFVRENIPRLIEKLNTHGFEAHVIDCHLINPEILDSASLTDHLIDKNQGFLDLLI